MDTNSPTLTARDWLRQHGLAILVLLLFLGFGTVYIFSRAMNMGYNHDENQFIASASLLARQGLLPYLDYPYFHMPNLVFIYALLYRVVSTLLLWTRVFSVLCGAGALGLLVFSTYGILRAQPIGLRLSMAVGAGLLLLANPLFAYTSGRAWNHDAPPAGSDAGFSSWSPTAATRALAARQRAAARAGSRGTADLHHCPAGVWPGFVSRPTGRQIHRAAWCTLAALVGRWIRDRAAPGGDPVFCRSGSVPVR
jgi:hypothetical protein